GRQVFQVIDQVGMTEPATKWSAEAVSAAQIPYLLGRAYNEANAGRKGAVHLTIPVDVFGAASDTSLPMPEPLAAATLAPAASEVQEALAQLFSAKRPVVIAGSGVWWGHAERELERFLRLTKLPLYTVTMARGIVPDDGRSVLGYADPAINKAVL